VFSYNAYSMISTCRLAGAFFMLIIDLNVQVSDTTGDAMKYSCW
jgi:hypothetical protein